MVELAQAWEAEAQRLVRQETEAVEGERLARQILGDVEYDVMMEEAKAEHLARKAAAETAPRYPGLTDAGYESLATPPPVPSGETV